MRCSTEVRLARPVAPANAKAAHGFADLFAPLWRRQLLAVSCAPSQVVAPKRGKTLTESVIAGTILSGCRVHTRTLVGSATAPKLASCDDFRTLKLLEQARPLKSGKVTHSSIRRNASQ
jgi:hypothetical protein